MVRFGWVVVVGAVAGCGVEVREADGGTPVDGGTLVDAGTPDAGEPDAGPTVAALCDLAGVWDLVLGGTGGICRNRARPPSPLTLTSDGGAVHVDQATGLASDGGCGLTVKFDYPDTGVLDPQSRYTTLSLTFTGTSVTGTATMSLVGFPTCTEVAPVMGTRR